MLILILHLRILIRKEQANACVRAGESLAQADACAREGYFEVGCVKAKEPVVPDMHSEPVVRNEWNRWFGTMVNQQFRSEVGFSS